MLSSSTPGLFDLQLLDAVAELGSLGQAAARHGISQAAVSVRMSQLEHRLGIVLLRRGPTGTQLTPAGRQIADLGRQVLAAAEVMMDGAAALAAAQARA
jgi:DNA-binding transcriptional LysR family regulator